MKLVVDNLSAARTGHVIFSNVSFNLADGEVMIITGKNGSGKSTLLRAIAGLLPLECGKVSVEQENSDAFPHELMHYLGHLNALKPALTIAENLKFWQQYCANPLLDIEQALKAVALPGMGHLPAAFLSAGQKRRVAIAKLLVSYKPIWIVDEPTAALDKSSEKLFAELIKSHQSKGGITLAATHKPLGFDQRNSSVYKKLNMDNPDVAPIQAHGVF